jgi:hypothetical protein
MGNVVKLEDHIALALERHRRASAQEMIRKTQDLYAEIEMIRQRSAVFALAVGLEPEFSRFWEHSAKEFKSTVGLG